MCTYDEQQQIDDTFFQLLIPQQKSYYFFPYSWLLISQQASRIHNILHIVPNLYRPKTFICLSQVQQIEEEEACSNKILSIYI